jgi:hypothetical protein
MRVMLGHITVGNCETTLTTLKPLQSCSHWSLPRKIKKLIIQRV